MRMRDFNNVENLGQTTSTPVNFLGNKRIVESMLMESLNAFKFVQHRFNIASTQFNNVERMLKQMLKQFAQAVTLEGTGRHLRFEGKSMV